MALKDFVTGERLSSFAKKLKKNIFSDLLDNKKIRYITQAEYNALSEDDKMNQNIVWTITDPELVQADWNQDDPSQPDYIQNKPEIQSGGSGAANMEFLTQEEYNVKAQEGTLESDTLYIIG